ncbi:hypothetical protein HPB50_008338 [Hyalomma asiaticum]|uniref:Uncharacterized protein n=1 Tax=Hyalomma asiaticum TaxID=266040 RepID=A0ACB7RNV8_HYAAI|nr:hypothetical protein HPB50_008338 [Hyalomma asiaticum]
MRRRAPPEDVGPPVSHTAVGQRLLQIFRERQETAQSIARETSGETHAVMQEMLPELRVPGNRTIRECEQELEQSAATASQGGEEREVKTDAPVSQDNQNEMSRSETEAIADGAGKPLERLINLPEESKHTPSDSASRTAQESKQKLSSPAAARSPDLEPESLISETVSQDRRNEPPQQSTTVPAHSADVPSQITAELADYRQGQSPRSYIDQPPRVFQRQSISPLNLWPRKPTLMQSRTSAFTLVRKVLFEEPPPHLEEQATSSTKLPDDSAEPAMKAGPSVPRKISPLPASSEQRETPVSLQRLGKRNVSSGSESTNEESSVGPPASKRRVTDVSGLREPPAGKLGDCTSDKGTVASGDDCGSDVDMASPSSTPRSSKQQLEREHTSPAHESESTKIADDNCGGAKEPSGSESDITVVQFKGVAKGLSYSEARSDSSEMSTSGGAGAVARSGHGSSTVASNSSNTADKDRNTRAESDTARSGAGRTSQDSCSEDKGLTETGGEKRTQGSGDNEASTPPSAEGAEGHEVLEDVQAPHSDSEVEAGDATADSQAKEA